MRPAGRGIVIYALVLFAVMLAVALFGEWPFSLIAWGVALVSALFLAVFFLIPSFRRP